MRLRGQAKSSALGPARRASNAGIKELWFRKLYNLLKPMPLLQLIVHELDTELTRLHTLRKVVADLSRTPALVRRATEAASKSAAVVSSTKPARTAKPAKVVAPPVVSLEKPKAVRRPRRASAAPRTPKASKPVEESRALARTVPSGPVVFYPGRPVQAPPVESAAAAEQEALPTYEANPADLDAQSRQLAARWAAGATL